MAFVEVTKKDHIAVVTMNRPEALNALHNYFWPGNVRELENTGRRGKGR